jgi:protein required for attachment to host cells
MQTNWLVVADEGVAHIYQWQDAEKHLQEIETLTHPPARAHEVELRRDAYGRRTGHAARPISTVTSSASLDDEHGEAIVFARRVADWLDQARLDGRYHRLHLAAAPRFLGLLRRSMTPQVAALVVDELAKDLVNESHTDLEHRFLGQQRR